MLISLKQSIDFCFATDIFSHLKLSYARVTNLGKNDISEHLKGLIIPVKINAELWYWVKEGSLVYIGLHAR